MHSRPPTIWLVAAVLAAASLSPPLLAADEHERKSIDALTPDELANYEHAIATMREISRQNPTSKDGYAYFAALHNSVNVGPCEHRLDSFLGWHRAHLVEFEKALRRSDPPRTANVAIPYWDWTAPPSGERYPEAFERVDSPLHHPGRRDTPICKQGSGAGCQRLPWPWTEYMKDRIGGAGNWSGIGPKGFAGVSNEAAGCSERRSGDDRGYGALEQPSHNDMHGVYIGGDMGDPYTAAKDPIFWSFHAFIDLLFDQWQNKAGRTVDTCLDCKFCGLFKDGGAVPWTGRDLTSIADLGYRYVWSPAPETAPPVFMAAGEAGPFPIFPAVDFALSGELPVAVERTREITVPESVGDRVLLRLDGVPVPRGFSYQGNVFLYPKDETLDPRERGFREAYLVDLFSIWKAHDHGEEGHEREEAEQEEIEVEIVLDLEDELRALAAEHAGETWLLTVALVAETRAEGAGLLAAEPETSFAEQMRFDSMRIEGLP